MIVYASFLASCFCASCFRWNNSVLHFPWSGVMKIFETFLGALSYSSFAIYDSVFLFWIQTGVGDWLNLTNWTPGVVFEPETLRGFEALSLSVGQGILGVWLRLLRCLVCFLGLNWMTVSLVTVWICFIVCKGNFVFVQLSAVLVLLVMTVSFWF